MGKKSKDVDCEVQSGEAASEFVPDTQPVVVVEAEKIDAEEIRERTIQIKKNLNQNYNELCENFYIIRRKQLYQVWGYPTLAEYCAKELDFKRTKFLYLASIWEKLAVNQGKDIFEKVMELGWSKGKELARIATRENLNEWIDKGRILPLEGFTKEIREEIRKKIPEDPKEALNQEKNVQGTPTEKELKTMTMTVNYEDYLTIQSVYDLLKTDYPEITLGAALAMAGRELLGSYQPKPQVEASQQDESLMEENQHGSRSSDEGEQFTDS